MIDQQHDGVIRIDDRTLTIEVGWINHVVTP
jgi:hypothetical protein